MLDNHQWKPGLSSSGENSRQNWLFQSHAKAMATIAMRNAAMRHRAKSRTTATNRTGLASQPMGKNNHPCCRQSNPELGEYSKSGPVQKPPIAVENKATA